MMLNTLPCSILPVHQDRYSAMNAEAGNGDVKCHFFFRRNEGPCNRLPCPDLNFRELF